MSGAQKYFQVPHLGIAFIFSPDYTCENSGKSDAENDTKVWTKKLFGVSFMGRVSLIGGTCGTWKTFRIFLMGRVFDGGG
jgi:hypothetical protein